VPFIISLAFFLPFFAFALPQLEKLTKEESHILQVSGLWLKQWEAEQRKSS
jgi:hypothetical protein